MMRRAGIAILMALSIGLGALREFLFINLNYQIDHVDRSTQVSYAHSLFQQWVAGWGPRPLHMLKWSLSLVFIAAMGAVGIILMRLLVGDHRYSRVLLIGLPAVALVALVLHASSSILPPLDLAAVHLVHLLQYPALPMVVLLGWWAGGRPHRSKG